nr:MAG TPA: hypothetical protein [Crassvirales sp.]
MQVSLASLGTWQPKYIELINKIYHPLQTSVSTHLALTLKNLINELGFKPLA